MGGPTPEWDVDTCDAFASFYAIKALQSNNGRQALTYTFSALAALVGINGLVFGTGKLDLLTVSVFSVAAVIIVGRDHGLRASQDAPFLERAAHEWEEVAKRMREMDDQ